MHILMVHPHDIFSSAEPWTVRIVYLAKEFVKKGHRVTLVYFPVEWQNQQPLDLEYNIRVVPLSRRHGPRVLLRNIVIVSMLAREADVIHFQKCFYHAAVPAILASYVRNKHLHYDWDDWELKIYEVSTQPGILRNMIWRFLYSLESIIPHIADTVSVASDKLRRECLKIGIRPEKIFEAHVGADIEKFHPQTRGESVRTKYGISRLLVLYLGQLHGGQYVEIFIDAAAMLVKKHDHEVTFMIVGDGYRAGELKKRAYARALDGKVIFAGSVPHDTVPRYIAAADICVACFERNEVTECKSPLKIVEYLACGKAIVASNVGEVPRMIEDAGILIPPGDPVSLMNALDELLANRELRIILGKKARKRAEVKYNWATTAQNLLCAYTFV